MESSKKNNIGCDIFYVGLILIISVLICLPLFKDQFIKSCDYAGTLMRVLSMKQCFGHGQWVVRWVPQLFSGYGYPVFNFYPPLFYLMATLIMNLGVGILSAVNLSFFIALFLSGYFMYLFAREFFGREGALIAAVAYLLAPYHIVDLYLRAAAAETVTFIFLPLILWSFYKLHQTSKKRYLLYSALSSSALLLTHNCTSFIFFPCVFLYILFLYWPFASYQRCISFLQSLLALAVGVGLAAFFWLPAFIEKKFVHTENLLQGNLNYTQNFLSFKDLFSAPWGNSMPFFKDNHLFCQIGLLHGALILIALIGLKKMFQRNPSLKKQFLFFIILLLGSIFFTLTYSRFIWDHVHILQFIQFPFRFLTIFVFAGSVITGGIALLIPQKHSFKITFLVILVIFFTNFFYCHPWGTFTPDLHVALQDPDRFLSELVPQDGGDYIPIWVKNGTQGLPAFSQSQKLSALTPGNQIIESKKMSLLRYKFKVQAQEGSIFCFHSFYYPGWTVKVDGKNVEISKDNPWGLIVFTCSEGTHDVEIYFGTTPLRQTAKYISIASMIFLILILLFLKIKRVY